MALLTVAFSAPRISATLYLAITSFDQEIILGLMNDSFTSLPLCPLKRVNTAVTFSG